MFGFPVYSSLGTEPDIPYPDPRDSLSGGHAVLAVGYDDHHQCPNADEGALRIRNSWGTGWGDHGYGWLPYKYVREGLATDFWACFKLDWVTPTRSTERPAGNTRHNTGDRGGHGGPIPFSLHPRGCPQ